MDFHCHLDLYPNARAVHAEAARRNAFTWLVTTSPKAFMATSRVLGNTPTVLITPGLHPEIAHERADELGLLLSQIETMPAVGEVGLDGSPRYRHSYAVQHRIFGAVVKRCRELGGRTLSIHSRRAVKDVLIELRRNPGFGTAVLHWFTGSSAELKAAKDLGCWFSIGPAAFNSASGKSLAKSLPKDRVVPESDGPFAQVDGKPVMPWSLASTAQLLAVAWAVSPREAVTLLEQNSNRLLRAMGLP
ncbi:TatD DNase family protein [Modicisalibacter muralis]|uniref:TatD DNase family protein n=1 Tax=Modicisalibacter muralis TaxID=119000 RepID=A0A1G9LI90_9GAMM|nr:Qat anti-phage system TatD family nuclease QatD [Halomonas muralis]SDL61616.1 TatD DNase family protein [Halomonas muralis]